MIKKHLSNITGIFNNKKIYLWDDKEIYNKNYPVVYWNNFNKDTHSKFSISIIDTIELNSDYYKKKYLRKLDDFGKLNFKNKNFIDSLVLKDNFSMWWSSLIFE